MKQARHLFLKQQGLHKQAEFGRGKSAALAAIERLSYLQIDTIAVVNRAHEHILASRVPNYQSKHLTALMAERKIFEYWGHAAAFLPFETYRYSLPVMAGWRATRERDGKLADMIVDRIRSDGPMQSRDFEDTENKKRGGWWEWKPAKRALEHLFLAGDLMVTRRDGFQKVFDLPERVIPAGIDTSMPDTASWCRHLIMSMTEALGAATEQDLGYAKSTIRQLAGISLKKPLRQTIDTLVEAGDLVTLGVEGTTYYTTPKLLESRAPRIQKAPIKFLSPFDNLVINRKRARALFDFDYQLECYVPAAKRRFGYFSLPMLYGDQLVGRADLKADRSNKTLIIRNLALEPKGLEARQKVSHTFLFHLESGLRQFADSHACETIHVEKSNHPVITRHLKAMVKQ